MEINLILTAKSWELASQLERTETFGGVLMIKNVPERTYLAVTPEQWQVLARFGQPHTVPQVLESVIDDRICPALAEFYELILKAVRARMLVVPNQTVAAMPAVNWPVAIKPGMVRYVLWLLFASGLGLSIALRPSLPASFLDGFASFAIMILCAACGAALAASILRGAGGEIYRRGRWFIRNVDACMLPPPAQRTVNLSSSALFAGVTGILVWHRPAWSLFPLVGLLYLLRPILGGRVNAMIQVGAARRLSDPEHAYMFPPNRTPRVRWRLLKRSLRSPTTWLEIGYGVTWTLALGYFFGALTDVQPWKLAFWQTEGLRLVLAIVGSLALLGLGYMGSELYVLMRERAIARRDTVRQFGRRWFGTNPPPTNEHGRMRAVLRSPLLRMLPPPVQQAVAKSLKPEKVGPWRTLHDFDAPVGQISLILSGKVGVYRKLRSGRRNLVQVLCEDDLVGLHAIGDPENPQFLYRTLTPVLLLRLDWSVVQEVVLARLGPGTIANQVQKLPFLTRMTLCQNWHFQAIQRFAELSRIVTYAADEVILQAGFFSESFYIVFEGEARISSRGKIVGVLHGSDFFGEIGLLQNSNAMAQVRACVGTRCLCIPRREFLRFVAHNYTVALELERVSSKRLGRPIFPLVPGDFRPV